MSATDFMPIKGWDHLELYVGNAKQAAYYYERALGFRQTAYAGPETGLRDRASYVLDQNDIRRQRHYRIRQQLVTQLTMGVGADNAIVTVGVVDVDSVLAAVRGVPAS